MQNLLWYMQSFHQSQVDGFFITMKTTMINIPEYSFFTFVQSSPWNQFVQLESVGQSTDTFYTVMYLVFQKSCTKLFSHYNMRDSLFPSPVLNASCWPFL